MKRNLLVVIDDSELDLAILKEIFKSSFNVKCIDNVVGAQTFIEKNSRLVCAILVDVCIGRKNAGLDLLKKLNKGEKTKQIPSIMITSDPSREYVMDGISNGAVDFIVKPVDPAFVSKRVHEIVQEAWSPKKPEPGSGDPQSDSLSPDGQESQAGGSSLRSDDPVVSGQPAERKKKELTLRDKLYPKTYKKNRRAPGVRPTIYSIFECLPTHLSEEQLQILTDSWSERMDKAFRNRANYKMSQHMRIKALTEVFARSYFKMFPSKENSAEKLRYIIYGSQFYDIGLMMVPDHIIAKGENQDSYSDEKLFYSHVDAAEILLQPYGVNNPFIKTIAEIIEFHHKNLEGKSYPVFKKVSEIPLSAQLVRMAIRIDKYICKYFGNPSCAARSIRAMRSEVGRTVHINVFRAAEKAVDELQDVIDNTYNSTNISVKEFRW